MLIQKGANVFYWPTPKSPAPLNNTLGASLPASVYKVVGNTGRSAFISSGAVTVDLTVAGAKSTLRAVPVVIGTPTAENLASGGFCTTRPYIPPPPPLPFEQALAQVKLGKTARRPGGQLTPADVAAADWTVS